MSDHPLNRLRHHVTGAIERGEKEAIVGIPPVQTEPLTTIIQSQLLADGWRKVPSVTPGGKPHFWFKPGEPKQWIVWNRERNQWEKQSS